MSSSTSEHRIIILGANFGGVDTAHYLLRQTIPKLEQQNSSTTYHVTLVSPNTHFFFKIASPRTLVSPSSIPREKIFRSITEAFAQYPQEKFDFVRATASSVDPRRQVVTVQSSQTGSDERQFSYDSLVISTGCASNSPLWSIHGDHELTVSALKSMQKAISTAETIIVGGGGPVGVETAGEIASNYPEVKVTLVSSSSRLLTQGTITMSVRAVQYLKGLGVEVLNAVRIENETPSPDGKSTTVKMSNGSGRKVDVYIDATGSQHANTAFLPSSWLDDSGRVLIKDDYFRVNGSKDDANGVYVIGDIVAGSKKTAIELDAMVPTMCSALTVDIAAGWSSTTKDSENDKRGILGYVFGLIFGHSQQKFVMRKVQPFNALAVPIGPNGGVGQVMGWSVPSFMVKSIKSKNFLMELLDPLVTGEHRAKA